MNDELFGEELPSPEWANNEELQSVNAKLSDLDSKLSSVIELLEAIAKNTAR